MSEINAHFLDDELIPGDIFCFRSRTTYGKGIRSVLGSYTNHNGLFVRRDGMWYIGEAITPESVLTPLPVYEDELGSGSIARVFRVPKATPQEREAVEEFFLQEQIGIPYPVKQMWKLLAFRVVNNLPWRIRGEWCTRLVWDAWGHIDPGIFNRPDGKRKKNPTPRTLENRLVAGVVIDVTSQVLVWS